MDDKLLKRLSSSFAEAELKFTFFLHISAYLAVNALFLAINLHGASHQFWAKWPITLWGMILIIHILLVFRTGPQKKGNIRQDMIKKGFTGL